MNRLRPHVTGLALGLALASWGGLRTTQRPLGLALRWGAAGLGTAALATHVMQRMDESADARRRDRRLKLKLMGKAIKAEARRPKHRPEPAAAEENWLEQALAAETHLNDEAFEDETIDIPSMVNFPLREVLKPAEPAAVDPQVAFDLALADGQWAQAIAAYNEGTSGGGSFQVEPAVLNRLRSSVMDEIFRRMHSGSVRDDVARLAQALVESFPESKEGLTLAQVMPVLRRSAGLCPRCARPYTGIANACHDCLRGTPEAYQIAWDEDGPPAAG